eukprot:1781306-Prymnesium_polylepis.1
MLRPSREADERGCKQRRRPKTASSSTVSRLSAVVQGPRDWLMTCDEFYRGDAARDRGRARAPEHTDLGDAGGPRPARGA